ncbi:MAG: hypothetical protein GF307_13165 [candidate division Zixibacteria bacterium]|nr:hypothetical protein [candidate division Zixibacteria bacterium]
MSKRTNLIAKIFIPLAIFAGIMLMQGCGKMSPVAPTTTEQADLKDPFGDSQVESQWGRVYSQANHPPKGMTPNGVSAADSMHFNVLGYETRFIVPGGATPNTGSITCSPSNFFTASGMVYIFDFGPDGLTFSASATLEIEMAALEDYNPNDKPFVGAEIYYFNPSTGAWELQEVDTDIGDGKVEFNIDHFSRYGIGGRTL